MNYVSKITTVSLCNSKPIPALLKGKDYTINNINFEEKYTETLSRVLLKLKQEEFICGICIQTGNSSLSIVRNTYDCRQQRQ